MCTTTGGIAGIVRTTYDASAGSRRGSIAHTTTSASRVAVAGRDRRDPAVADHEVGRLGAGEHGDLAGRQPLLEGGAEAGHASLDRPRAEALLDVRRHPGPGRDVAQVVARGLERVPRDLPQPLVLEGLLEPLEHRLPAVEAGGEVAREVVGRPRVLEVATAQHLPVVGVRRDVVDPSLTESAAQLVERRELRRPPDRDPHRRTVVEPVLAHDVERHQVELAFQRPAGLAEEVAHHGRQERVRRPRVPGEAVLRHLRQGSAQLVRALHERDLVAQLRQSDRGGESSEATSDDDDPRHSTSISGAPVIAASSSYVEEKTAAGCPAAAHTTS